MRAVNKGSSFLLLIPLLLLLCCIACKKQEPQNKGPRYGATVTPKGGINYKFGILPNQTQKNMIEDYLPVIDYLNNKFKNVRFSLDTSKDYSSYEAKIQEAKDEYILANPWQTLEAIKAGYHVIAMVGDAKEFKGLLVARTDSGIKTPPDLNGKSVSYPAPTALASCVMIQYLLHNQGIDVVSELNSRYVGSLDSAIMNAYLRQTAAAGTSPRGWHYFQEDHPTEAQKLMIILETPPLVNNSVMARKDVPSDIQEGVSNYLLKLHETPQGLKILAGIETDRFYAATDNDYEIVRSFVTKFEREVRTVKLK